ncbi:hypothetical protein JL722_4141 [Aureococcus anophagefferens]|nr:hypothetical protein JL722_4141 [Aureococcus anophagefferens]
MGAAASLAERHVEADISLADAKALVPPGAWDDRWDGQFGAAAGRVDRRVGLALLARRLEHLGGARDWAAAPSPVGAQAAAAAAARDRAWDHKARAAAERGRADAAERATRAARRGLRRGARRRPARDAAPLAFAASKIVDLEAKLAAAARAERDGAALGAAAARAAALERVAELEAMLRARTTAAPRTRGPRRRGPPRRLRSTSRRSGRAPRRRRRRRARATTRTASARTRRTRRRARARSAVGAGLGADLRGAARAAARRRPEVRLVRGAGQGARARRRRRARAGRGRDAERLPRRARGDEDDAAGKPVEYRGYVYTSGTLAAGCPGMDLGRVVCHSSYCDTEEVWRIANDWPFATDICTWDGKGTYDGPAQEEDGYTGADCWKAAPDPANEDDEGRTEQNKENRATDWECDMLHDQHDVFYKVLIGLFYICPLTAFVFSCISQAHPEGPDKFWGQPAKVAPANM